jgi:tagatose 1,6-diphosphate aldolase
LISVEFLKPEVMRDGNFGLDLVATVDGNDDPSVDRVAVYNFAMMDMVTRKRVGNITLRLTEREIFLKYFGQIGYSVEEGSRGSGFAARAVKLLMPLARAHGFEDVWITCNPDNQASVRTAEAAGFGFVELVEIPKGLGFHRLGEYEKLRYRKILD